MSEPGHSDQPLVSIIIPCYNSEAYVAEAIESALAQTYPHCEVVVINDGSQDASGEVIERYQDRVRYIQTENLGACHARNLGLRAAIGERVQWLDADDVLRPNCVENKLSMRNGNTPDGNHIIPICDVVAMPGGTLPAIWNRPRYDLFSGLGYGTPPTPAPLHYKADLLAIGGFREDLPCAQELDLHLRLLAKRKCEFISTGEVGVDIRTHDNNLSQRAGVKMHYTVLSILERIQADHVLSEKHNSAIAHHRIRTSQQLWRKGHKAEALAIYRQALTTLPRGVQPHYFANAEGWMLKAIGLDKSEALRGFISPLVKPLLNR